MSFHVLYDRVPGRDEYTLAFVRRDERGRLSVMTPDGTQFVPVSVFARIPPTLTLPGYFIRPLKAAVNDEPDLTLAEADVVLRESMAPHFAELEHRGPYPAERTLPVRGWVHDLWEAFRAR